MGAPVDVPGGDQHRARVSAPVPWLKIPDGALQQPAHLYISAPRKWRQEEATSSSLPPPLADSLLVSLHHSQGVGGGTNHQDPPDSLGCLGKGFQQRGVRLQALHLLTLSRCRNVVRYVSRISFFQHLTQHCNLQAPLHMCPLYVYQ